jgi:hypothetical protein
VPAIALAGALNEAARLLAIEVDAQAATAAVRPEVLTLPPEGHQPHDRRRLGLSEVSRVAASYRDGHWDDPNALGGHWNWRSWRR